MKGYGPSDPRHTPRIAGVSTFLRLPHTLHLDDVDVAVVGLPFDSGASHRAGSRFGPRAIREGSLFLRPFYNPSQRLTVFDRISAVDYGDAQIAPGFVDRSYERMGETLAQIHAAGAVPLGLGGDHGVLLPELRAAAQKHGRLALILFAAHADPLDGDYGERESHVSLVQQAVGEGLIDPLRSTLLGMRGGLYHARELEEKREAGFAVIAWDELAHLGTGAVAAAAERASGRAFLSFNLDFVDPAFAPGTSTPECGGPTSAQALALLRGCRGLDIVGADVVEVLPDLDTSRLTATLAATVAWEVLCLIAASRPQR